MPDDKYEDYIYQKTNREKNLSPKGGIRWCGACYMNIVALGRKCPFCRNINGKSRHVQLKKETNS